MGTYWLLIGHWQLRNTTATRFLSRKSASPISLPVASGRTNCGTRRPTASLFRAAVFAAGVLRLMALSGGAADASSAGAALTLNSPTAVPATAIARHTPTPMNDKPKRIARSSEKSVGNDLDSRSEER